MAKRLIFSCSVIESILSYAASLHPREGILIVKGRVKKDEIAVEEVEVPPLAVHGYSFSDFPLHMLPFDLSIVGTAHSHPSGALRPSTEDLNNFYGRIMVIAAYPYSSEQHLAVFDKDGKMVKYEVASKE